MWKAFAEMREHGLARAVGRRCRRWSSRRPPGARRSCARSRRAPTAPSRGRIRRRTRADCACPARSATARSCARSREQGRRGRGGRRRDPRGDVRALARERHRCRAGRRLRARGVPDDRGGRPDRQGRAGRAVQHRERGVVPRLARNALAGISFSAMKIAILDPFSGIAGDMMLGALLDAGLDPDWLRALPARLGLEGVTVRIERVKRAGISCWKVDFDIPPQPHGRHLKEIRAIVERAALPAAVSDRALAAFDRAHRGGGRDPRRLAGKGASARSRRR